MNDRLIFRGSLQHGVAGTLATAGSSKKRLTLLVNWWKEMPLAPNCAEFPSEDWDKLGLLLTDEEVRELQEEFADHEPESLAWPRLAPGSYPSQAMRWVAIETPPTNLLFFRVPDPMPRGSWEVVWAREEHSGPMVRMDLDNRMSTRGMFLEVRPKLIIVLATNGKLWGQVVPDWILSLQRELDERFVFVLADPATCQNFIDVFQIPNANLPTAVIHDTVKEKQTNGEEKYRLGEPLSEGAVRRLVDDFFQRSGRPPSKQAKQPAQLPAPAPAQQIDRTGAEEEDIQEKQELLFYLRRRLVIPRVLATLAAGFLRLNALNIGILRSEGRKARQRVAQTRARSPFFLVLRCACQSGCDAQDFSMPTPNFSS